MREIKFRAWDKERKEIRKLQLIDFSNLWVSTGSASERENAFEYGEKNSFKNEETDRHILMQFTGLKDSEGIEIYEGDIYLANYSPRLIGTVLYKKGRIVISEKNGNDYPITFYEGKVLGNIFENPEKLNY